MSIHFTYVSRQTEHPAASSGSVDPAASDWANLCLLAVDTFEFDLAKSNGWTDQLSGFVRAVCIDKKANSNEGDISKDGVR